MNIDNFGLYTVDTNYVKQLYAVDSEVFYENHNYSNKPYLGIVVNNNNYYYFIPLTSAKEKHKKWKNVSKDYYIIYEIYKKEKTNRVRFNGEICVDIKDGNIKHILSVLDIKKMIPVPKSMFKKIIFKDVKDTNYKNLLIKEYNFLKPLKTDILQKAEMIYNKQIETGIVYKYYCSFKKLESVCDKKSLINV